MVFLTFEKWRYFQLEHNQQINVPQTESHNLYQWQAHSDNLCLLFSGT